METFLIFPHQLFEPLQCPRVILVEDELFFSQYPFHKQKLVLHRASMKYYAKWLESKQIEVHYLENKDFGSLSRVFLWLKNQNVFDLSVYEPSDYLLERRLLRLSVSFGVKLRFCKNPGFLSDSEESVSLLGAKKSYLMGSFYISQRKRLGILLDEKGEPQGGKWSFDTENRKKAPKNLVVAPEEKFSNSYVEEAIEYVERRFPKHFGQAKPFGYPTTHAQARQQLNFFVEKKLSLFGDYEDAMLMSQPLLNHSVLTPALNIGLLTPAQVIEAVLEQHKKKPIPLNSLEGFIRQVIGWREFIRGIYQKIGVQQRLSNFWKHERKMPQAFYSGQTGIEPVDHCIKKLLKTGYLHHIERLMVLGAFMNLCEIDPNDVYQWFMELFIDAYDWVMVPNVYGMSQYADGGLITTKPYICGSNYILKMSDYPSGKWCEIWDALYWRFVYKHESVFAKNPRMSVMAIALKKMNPDKLEAHISKAEEYLASLK
jgi:deoxyribodipyrimidine photolyase-related protein